jgi:hypothetical protein
MPTRKEQLPLTGAPPLEAPLSPRLAFVVQFRANHGGARTSYTGRVEHMTSGRVTHFRSRSELWSFLTQIVAEAEQESKAQENVSHLRPDRLLDEEL